MRKVGRYIIGASLFAVSAMSGCSGKEPAGGDDMIGTATFELAAAPSDARCLSIVVAGSRTVTRQIGLMPGEPTTFTLNGLPLGSVTFTESAFAVDCGTVTAATIATWQSDPTPATLQAGVAASVTVVLRRNGTANVTSDFQDDTPACMPPLQACPVGGMSQCVDVTSDASNCGACGTVCQPVANAASICSARMCTFICNVAFRDCNNTPVDGCETNINVDPNNCGACGTICLPGVPCQNGACAAPPRIQVSSPMLQFPATPVGDGSAPLPLQITNTGGTPLQLLSEMIAGPAANDFAFFPTPPPTLAPGQTFVLQVEFDPILTGTRQATLIIQSNDPMLPRANVQLVGVGAPMGPPL
jgi:hypothetical protein